MVSPGGHPGPSLAEEVVTKCYEFEFHQAVKILELMNPRAMSLGRGAIPHQEAMRLKSRILFSYPSSDLFNIIPEKSIAADSTTQGRMIVHVNFLGIAGANGPLPLPYSEIIAERLKASDSVAADFLDIFNHRLLSLLHRIRRKYWIGLDSAPPRKTRMAQVLRSFLGLSTPGLQRRLTVPDHHLFLYAGLFWQKPRSVVGLRIFLSHYFKCPVTISSFQGGWVPLERTQRTYLGRTFSHLGQGAALGTRLWNASQRIRVHLGPLNLQTFTAFLPGQIAYKKLCDSVRFYLDLHQQFDLNLHINIADIPPLVLGCQTHLGWNTWLNHKSTLTSQKNTVDAQVVLKSV